MDLTTIILIVIVLFVSFFLKKENFNEVAYTSFDTEPKTLTEFKPRKKSKLKILCDQNIGVCYRQ